MQYRNEKTLHLVNVLGQVIKKKRLCTNKSLNMFAYEYDLNPGNLCRIENGQIEAKFTMLWRIAEAFDIPLSQLIKELEDEFDEKFCIIDK